MTLRTGVCGRLQSGRPTAALDFLATFVYNRKVIKGKGKSVIPGCSYTLLTLDTMKLPYALKLSSIEDLGRKCISDGYFACEESVRQFVSDAKIIELIVAWMGDCCDE
jgi:hypothetical protein